MNKTQLIDAIAAQANITKTEARKSIDAFIKIVGDTLSCDDRISLVGFGTFMKMRKQGGVGRNPKTGAPVKFAPRNVVKFRAGTELTSRIK